MAPARAENEIGKAQEAGGIRGRRLMIPNRPVRIRRPGGVARAGAKPALTWLATT